MAAPVVTKPTKQVSNVGVLATPLAVSATETPLEYKATGLPTGLSIVALTGKIEGTPTKGEKATVKLSAKNAEGTSPEVAFEWEVTDFSVVTKPANQQSQQNAAITPLKVTATNTPTEFKATSLPTGLTIAKETGIISGTPTTIEVAKVKLSAKNAEGTSAEVEFEWAIEDLSLPVHGEKELSTTTPLAAKAVVELGPYSTGWAQNITGFAIADQKGELAIEQTFDLIHFYTTAAVTKFEPNEAKGFSEPVYAPYVRLKFTNGNSEQKLFKLYTRTFASGR